MAKVFSRRSRSLMMTGSGLDENIREHLVREVLLHVCKEFLLLVDELLRSESIGSTSQPSETILLLPRSGREKVDLKLPWPTGTVDHNGELLAPPSLPILGHFGGLNAHLALPDVHHTDQK